jgi:hypothetical protein
MQMAKILADGILLFGHSGQRQAGKDIKNILLFFIDISPIRVLSLPLVLCNLV